MKLIVGLGNPGRKYENTRHNAGFMAADFLAEQFGFGSFKHSERHKAEIAEGVIGAEKAALLKPQTFMNLSGEAIRSAADFYKIPVADITVIYDDVALPFGTLRVRPDGSAGGHNGVRSVIQNIGDAFTRVRLGIQPKEPFPGALEDYVLGVLTKDQKADLEKVIEKLPELLKLLFAEGVDGARQRFN